MYHRLPLQTRHRVLNAQISYTHGPLTRRSKFILTGITNLAATLPATIAIFPAVARTDNGSSSGSNRNGRMPNTWFFRAISIYRSSCSDSLPPFLFLSSSLLRFVRPWWIPRTCRIRAYPAGIIEQMILSVFCDQQNAPLRGMILETVAGNSLSFDSLCWTAGTSSVDFTGILF